MSEALPAGLARPPAVLAPMQIYASSAGFLGDVRFAGAPTAAANPHEDACDDPLARAFAEGFASGAEKAKAQADARAQAEAEAQTGLGLSFARLDRELAEQLRQRLRDTVAALCEAALAPMALDEDALLRRIERALALLARADDERVIRLHPDDLALVSPRMAQDWQIVSDPSLDRGALRIEVANGGVEDGPAHWRAAIAEAFEQC